jgi:hypothetical protein
VSVGTRRAPRVDAFIFNWRGHEARAAALERQLGALCPVRVINSESAVEARHPQWHHVGEDAYFAAQWQRARELFQGDVLLHVQADASSRHFARILERGLDAIDRHGAGVYAPNVDYTPWTYDRRRLRQVDDDLFEVPQTDCTCWAITREVLERVPTVDPQRNKFGWGIDFLVAGAARARGRRILRDYRHTVVHPWRGAGYDTEAAYAQVMQMLEGLPAPLREMDTQLRREAEAVLGPQPWPRRLRQALRDTLRAVVR